MSEPPPALPGGTGITHVRVYDSVGPDGLSGGTPHLHTACVEAYLVIAGEGEVQTLSGDGYRVTPLAPGAVVWFTPGTVHRLVNHGGLELFVVMSNAGLPEMGDMVIAFADEILADAGRYDESAGRRADPDRRDLAVAAFAEWRANVERDPTATLALLHRRATTLVSRRASTWSGLVDTTSATATAEALSWVAAIQRGDATHLAAARLAADRPGEAIDRRAGCCGTLGIVGPRPSL